MNIDEQISSLSRRAERIITDAELRNKLGRGRSLRIKMGMDPTAPDVTLGHAVPLRVIRQFQDWGHKAVLIIGDYTARVGDPSGRNTTRPVLSGEEIDRNAQTYVNQVGKILLTGEKHLEVRYNGEWLAKMNLIDIIRLASRKTVAQILQRDDFARRYAEGTDIRLHEIMYPLLQGWDSVMIDADVEMGGSDQLFNNLVGREFQKEEGKEGQVVLVTPLLVGTDGKDKMSKSKGNYIAVTDPPGGQNGMFGKIMSLPDHLMEMYYTLLTDLPMEEVRQQITSNPRDAKVRLAKEIITWLHSVDAAAAAEGEFVKQFVRRQVPDEMPEVVPNYGEQSLAKLVCDLGLTNTTSEARRKIQEGAVRIFGEPPMNDPKQRVLISHHEVSPPADVIMLEPPFVMQLGRRFVRAIPRQ